MKWFKRKFNKLNQTTRLYSLYGESANLKYLEDRINNFQSADVDKAYVDNQDNNLSRKINANTASIANNVNSIVKLQNRVDNLPTVDTTNLAKLSSVSDQRWTSGNIFDGNTGFGSRINMNRNKIINLATPTDSTDAATKGYVDNLPKPEVDREYVDRKVLALNNRIKENVESIKTLRTTTAKLDGVSDQRWTSGNIFDGNTGFGSRINMNRNKIINLATPTDSTDAATKQYVDNRTQPKSLFGSSTVRTYNLTKNMEKIDYISNLWEYKCEITKDDILNIVKYIWPNYLGRNYFVNISRIQLQKIGKVVDDRKSYSAFYGFGNVQIHQPFNSSIWVGILSNNDLKPGSTGTVYDVSLTLYLDIVEIV